MLKINPTEPNLHALPSYACNDKHCYGGNEAYGCWQNNNHIDGHHNTTRKLFPASTHREAEWGISHSTTGKAFLALKYATVDLPNQSCRWWRLGGCLTLPTTTTSCMWWKMKQHHQWVVTYVEHVEVFVKWIKMESSDESSELPDQYVSQILRRHG